MDLPKLVRRLTLISATSNPAQRYRLLPAVFATITPAWCDNNRNRCNHVATWYRYIDCATTCYGRCDDKCQKAQNCRLRKTHDRLLKRLITGSRSEFLLVTKRLKCTYVDT